MAVFKIFIIYDIIILTNRWGPLARERKIDNALVLKN